jgi:hypothetical protein
VALVNSEKAIARPDCGKYRADPVPRTMFPLNCHRARYPSCNLQQVGLHVDDLVLAVPFAGEEVLQAIGLEPDGAVDEAVLVGAGADDEAAPRQLVVCHFQGRAVPPQAATDGSLAPIDIESAAASGRQAIAREISRVQFDRIAAAEP